MTLQRDPILGTCYLDPEAFVQRASVFGAGMSIQNANRDTLLALLASASREVDEICGRTFDGEEITETHRFNQRTRRISVNAPPVAELVAYRVLLGGGQTISYSLDDLYVNNQEGYVELLDFALGSSLATPLVPLGLAEAQIEIVYKTFADPPAAVKKWTGVIAAFRANEGFVNALVPQQFGELQIGGTRFRNTERELPASVRQGLAPFIRLAIG